MLGLISKSLTWNGADGEIDTIPHSGVSAHLKTISDTIRLQNCKIRWDVLTYHVAVPFFFNTTFVDFSAKVTL